MLNCGQGFYRTTCIHGVRPKQNHKVSRKILARLTECCRGRSNEYSENPPNEFTTVLNKVDETEEEIFLFSGYLGRLNVGTTVFDKVSKFGEHTIRIKIIDAQENGLDTNNDYSLKTLVECNPVCIDPEENEYNEYCKLIAYSTIVSIETRQKKKDQPIIDAFVSILSQKHKERAQEEFPEMFVDPPTISLRRYKEIYHTLLTRLCPVDVYFNVLHYFHFLYDTIGVVGVNNLNTIVCIVNVPKLENAYWAGQYAVFGNGYDIFYPLTSIDVVGHELSHGLVEGTARLEYWGESGALNESFADIFGSLFESYIYTKFNSDTSELYGNSDWYIGEDIMKSGIQRNLRNMEDPHKSYTPQPKFIGDVYYVDPMSQHDNGGVHINSGIPNHCFYMISIRSNILDASKLFYKCLCSLPEAPSFIQFAMVLIEHANKTGNSELISSVNASLSEIRLFKPKPIWRRCCDVFSCT